MGGAARGLGRWAIIALALCSLGTSCRPKKSRAKKPYDYGHFQFDEPRKAPPEEEQAEEPFGQHGWVHAKARFVWIRRKPDVDSDWLGYITLGQSVAVRRDRRGIVDGERSCRSWVPVEPKGWVCVGKDATLDESDETFQLLKSRTADLSSGWPFQYARSLGAPRYRTLPNARDQKVKEGDITVLLQKIEKARTAPGDAAIAAIDRRLVGVELALTGAPPPPSFEPGHPIMETDEDAELGSTIAYTYEFDHDNRAWLLGWDFSIIPQSRVKKYPRSEFHGVELGDKIELPIAFVRKQGAYRYTLDKSGAPIASKEMFEPHAMLELGEGQVDSEGRHLYATKEPGVYVSERDAVIVAPTGNMPRNVGQTARNTWIEVSTVGGWLVAYEGHTPVYATAISAGRAALNPDGTMVPSSSRPPGTFTIKNKLRTATMRSDRQPNRIHAEVMYTQVFNEDYALHGAYWHDDFGDRRSAGCVNLSPLDSKWLFDWTEPPMPRDWHAKKVDSDDVATVVVVHY